MECGHLRRADTMFILEKKLEALVVLRTAFPPALIGGCGQPGPNAPPSRSRSMFRGGAYHGGWCWRPVTDILESHGHKTYAPSLIGNADRGHLLNMDVNLDVQATDIVNLVKWEDLKNFYLVVHSFGGWPASAAMEHIYDRVASVVWADAFMPKDGQKALDDISPFSRKALEDAMARGEARRKPPPAKTYSINQSQYAWIDSKLIPQPNGGAFQAIKLTGKLQRPPRRASSGCRGTRRRRLIARYPNAGPMEAGKRMCRTIPVTTS